MFRLTCGKRLRVLENRRIVELSGLFRDAACDVRVLRLLADVNAEAACGRIPPTSLSLEYDRDSTIPLNYTAARTSTYLAHQFSRPIRNATARIFQLRSAALKLFMNMLGRATFVS